MTFRRSTNGRYLVLPLLTLMAALAVIIILISSFTASARVAAAVQPGISSAPRPVLASATPGPCNAWQLVYTSYISTTQAAFRGVDASAADNAWSVGFYDADDGHGRTLTEHWDGSKWNIIPSPNLGTATNALNAVSIGSPSDVWAVGGEASSGDFQALTEHWDGTSWSVVPAANIVTSTNAYMLGVKAVAGNDVWAVGTLNSTKALIEHWDGTSWTFVPSPDLSPGSYQLLGVAATASNDVWAVGNQRPTNSANYAPLIEHWNGIAWSIVPAPTVAGTDVQLLGVTARSANDAWATGWVGPNIFAEHWDGTQWSIATLPIMQGSLNAVTAISQNDVWAVGATQGGSGAGITLHWDGTAWSAVQPQYLFGNNVFYSIAATSSTDVWAAGSWHGREMVQHYTSGAPCVTPTATATATSTGTPATATSTSTPNPCTNWQPFPSPTVSNGSWLYGVSSLAPNDAWAVGHRPSEGGYDTFLAEHWDGSAWTSVPVPTATSTGYSDIVAVSGVSSSDVWAVGSAPSTSSNQTLPVAEHWDGTAWSSLPVPGVITASAAELYGVAAVSSGDAWAVGPAYEFADPAIYNQAIIEHWDGTAWSIVPSPIHWQDNSFLGAVTALSSNDVWAVGSNSPFDSVALQTMILHWDGHSWSVVPSPNGSSTGDILYGVTAISANNVWAVGATDNLTRPLALHWDGSTWSVVPVPANTGTLRSVSGSSGNDVWAVGDTGTANPGQAIALHWDGTAWSAAPVSSPGTSKGFRGVAAIGPGDVWGVGSATDSNNNTQQLIERYHDACATATPTQTPLPVAAIVGHVTWQGIAQPGAHNSGITATLTLCSGGTQQSYTVSTDASGTFTLTTNLPNGVFNWHLKGRKWLATGGTINLSGGTTQQEFGVQPAGDANNSNTVNTSDFVILKSTFGRSQGDQGYDERADFNADNSVNVTDFTLLKGSFGRSGATLNCP